MSTPERLQRDGATPEMNCWDVMRRFNVTRKGKHGLFEPILQHTATRLVYLYSVVNTGYISRES